MANQKHIDTLRKYAETNNSWILLRDDLSKKPNLLFKYPPGSWNITGDQIGLGGPENPNPPYVFWALNENAQWEAANEGHSLHVKGAIGWLIDSFETEEEINAKIDQIKGL